MDPTVGSRYEAHTLIMECQHLSDFGKTAADKMVLEVRIAKMLDRINRVEVENRMMRAAIENIVEGENRAWTPIRILKIIDPVLAELK